MAGKAFANLFDDRFRILVAGIVVRDDDNIGMVFAHLCHLGALAGIPVAPTAEYDDDAPCLEFVEAFEDTHECIVRMGKVYIDL